MIRRTMMVTAAIALGGCGGSKAPTPDTSAGAVPSAAVPAIDSAKADSTRLAMDTTVKAAAAKSATAKAPLGDHDVALKPKFSIDEKTGKVTPIKRP